MLLTVAATMTEAQEPIRIFGSVQWIASSTMVVMTPSGFSVSVDLTQADQSSYHALRTGEYVTVDGVVSADRRRVVAFDIWREEVWGQAP